MKTPFLFLILVITIVQISGCCKAECYEGDVLVSFQNYTNAETDTVIFIGTTGTKTDSAASITPPSANDTAKSVLIKSLHPHSDWVVKMPSVNKEFHFSDFEFEDQKCMCGNKKMNVLKSYAINGVQQSRLFYVLPR